MSHPKLRDGLPPLTERQWQTEVVNLARHQGWLVYHTYDSRRSEPGFPDLVLVRGAVIFVELKTDKGRLTKAQKRWLTRLRDAGADVWVWRPCDRVMVYDRLCRKPQEEA